MMKTSISALTASPTKQLNTLKYTRQGTYCAVQDTVIVEEPLLVSMTFFDNASKQWLTRDLTVMMRTPGDDQLLVMGLLFSENIITSQHHVCSIRYYDQDSSHQNNQNKPHNSYNQSSPNTNNHIEIKLIADVDVNWQAIQRTFASQSSCGICGKSSLQALALASNRAIDESNAWLSCLDIIEFSKQLSARQQLFNLTGSVHGAGLIANKKWQGVFEDVGRHNAVDKVIGKLMQTDSFAKQSILVLSGRVSFELMQKAIMAGIAVVIAIGAPSSLAITAARQFNVTLVGFTKAEQFNVYSAHQRICHKT
ncbi:formate dehydrogenase accessory sulfurtransferase FdhD [Thalassotalea sp. PLHSN55]|uniref:formate dehydrogenase accessory sulfurtransferase FdhD n=1 Tax=Thalassotalea sp. PLHSN55 TaxID=3435888 RepID=UPI003F85DB72